MLTAYFDESFDESKRFYVVAGFVAPVVVWGRIETQWKQTLESFGIKTRYHAKDCYHGREEFEGWYPPQRDLLTKKLARIITHTHPISKKRRSGVYGVAHAVNWDDFNEIMPGSGFPHPYTFLFQITIRRLARWTYDSSPDEKLQIILDRGQFSGACSDIFNDVVQNPKVDHRERQNLQGISSQSSSEFVPLQASDLLAYRTLKYHLGRLDRGVIDVMRQSIELRGELFHTGSLLKALDKVERFELTDYLCRTLNARL
jgi:uncharacterized protein DUF3800